MAKIRDLAFYVAQSVLFSSLHTRISLLLAAILLIVAQLLLLVHKSDIAAHSISENCEICLLGSNLNNSHGFCSLPLPPATLATFAYQAPWQTAYHSHTLAAAYARGPPFHS